MKYSLPLKFEFEILGVRFASFLFAIAMLQPTADEAIQGNIVHSFSEPTAVTLVEDGTPMTAALMAAWAAELQVRCNNMSTGKAMTPQEAAILPQLGMMTASRICLADTQRSLKVKEDLFPGLLAVAGAGAVHPGIPVMSGLILPWFAQPMIEGRGTRRFRGRLWHPFFCWNFGGSAVSRSIIGVVHYCENFNFNLWISLVQRHTPTTSPPHQRRQPL